MSLTEITLIAIGLAMDAFAVSIAAGAAGHAGNPRAIFRLSFHFGLFQALMPLAGWLCGRLFMHFTISAGRWIAFGLLMYIGIKMVRSGLHPERAGFKRDPSKGWMMVLLSIATSVDAMAVGASLALLNVSIWTPCLVIGVLTGLISLAGVLFGGRLNRRFGPGAEITGGAVLVLIALRILFTG